MLADEAKFADARYGWRIDQAAEYTEAKVQDVRGCHRYGGTNNESEVLDADGKIVIFKFFFFSRSRGVK